MINLEELLHRDEIPIYTKNKEKPQEGRHLVKYRQEKLYNYYRCDYCSEEIRIEKMWHKRTGGVYKIPHSVTKNGDIDMALHNKCLKIVLKIFDEEG